MPDPLRILIHNWRDQHHPEAGGAEKYIAVVAEGLADRGHDVTFRTALYPGAVRLEMVNGVRYVRNGGKFGIYPVALRAQVRDRRRYDVVVDVQNGMPYLTPLVRRAPTVNLVHHVHREQWPVFFGPRLSRLGWFVESRVAPMVYRRQPYVTVSESTRRELGVQGVGAERIQVIHNGTDAVAQPDAPRSATPLLVVVGRLVPQKRVEFAIDALAALSGEFPELRLTIVGSGWWEPQLRDHVEQLGVTDRVEFTGFVSEHEKHEILARAWVHLLPSLKEGWGLVVVEAGVHATPTVAFHEAGGPTNSIQDERTGLLVHGGSAEFTAGVRRLLVEDDLRARLSADVPGWVAKFSWAETVTAWEEALYRATSLR